MTLLDGAERTAFITAVKREIEAIKVQLEALKAQQEAIRKQQALLRAKNGQTDSTHNNGNNNNIGNNNGHCLYTKQIGQVEKHIADLESEALEAQREQASPSDNSPNGGGPGTEPSSLERLDITSAPTPPLVEGDAQSPQDSSQPSTDVSTVDGPIGDGSYNGSRESRNSDKSVIASETELEVAGDDLASKA